MGESNVNLAALIGSRICHDLISPIGAITNGLELLDMSGGTDGPEMELIADSVGNAGARIKFFRIAYGAAGEQSLGSAEVTGILDDIGRGGRLKSRWMPVTPIPRTEVRLAFLALQCCETAMPFGGTVHLMENGGTWTVEGTADKLSLDPVLWEGLSNPSARGRITPAQVQFALLPELATEADRRVTVETSASRIILNF